MSYVAMRRMGCVPCKARARAGVGGASMRGLMGLSGMWWPEQSDGWIAPVSDWAEVNPDNEWLASPIRRDGWVWGARVGDHWVLTEVEMPEVAWSSMSHASSWRVIATTNVSVGEEIAVPGTAYRGNVRPMAKRWGIVGLSIAAIGGLIAGYHGYRRNGGSIGWGLGWGLLGAALPIVTVPVALAQGYGKRGR